jgi:transcriptional regulator with XRE-family HTH domain
VTTRTESQKRERVLELRRKGVRQAAIAADVELDRSTVSRIERSAGLPRTAAHGPIERVTDDQRERAAAMQAEGLSQAAIGERLGLPQQTVSRIEIDAKRGRRKRRSFSESATGLKPSMDVRGYYVLSGEMGPPSYVMHPPKPKRGRR